MTGPLAQKFAQTITVEQQLAANDPDYTLTVSWNGGGDEKALEIKREIMAILREVDPIPRGLMHGNHAKGTGRWWRRIGSVQTTQQSRRRREVLS